jgi:hypothetical protein
MWAAWDSEKTLKVPSDDNRFPPSQNLKAESGPNELGDDVVVLVILEELIEFDDVGMVLVRIANKPYQLLEDDDFLDR